MEESFSLLVTPQTNPSSMKEEEGEEEDGEEEVEEGGRAENDTRRLAVNLERRKRGREERKGER